MRGGASCRHKYHLSRVGHLHGPDAARALKPELRKSCRHQEEGWASYNLVTLGLHLVGLDHLQRAATALLPFSKSCISSSSGLSGLRTIQGTVSEKSNSICDKLKGSTLTFEVKSLMETEYPDMLGRHFSEMAE